ncbi:sucrase/ferredoxin-like family protein Fmi1 [Cladophialophora carrionii]|uniref:Altered inheritance of mitochondria protein 32 n=1 Tax=Cladophialophora carrionii TaxID=86049 RepID=A0A1C1CAS6_9EURO|nr:sucrase/ferredoxin-like family protein Fmi1 [Cladophialophora carrionii]
MPPLDQEIDHKNSLNGTISAHSQHLIISTGRSDWTSRIEDERENGTSWGKVVGDLKALLGRKGEFHDAFNATMISTSSFTPLSAGGKQSTKRVNGKGEWEEQDTADALLFPAFRHFTGLVPLSEEAGDTASNPHTESQPDPDSATSGSLKDFIVENLTPNTGDSISDTAAVRSRWHSLPITNPTILICSHGQRDSRCGILGPVLHDEFNRYLDQRKGDDPRSKLCASTTEVFVASEGDDSRPVGESGQETRAEEQGQSIDKSSLEAITSSTTSASNEQSTSPDMTVNVGMISHIGGHKWAGNVIIYMPPGFSADVTTSEPAGANSPDVSQRASGVRPLHPLAGMSIWYGRVEPRHVERIVEQTIFNGKVIRELFRGGLSQRGQLVRL